MSIARFDTFLVNVPYTHAEISARVRRGGVTAVLVRLETDAGLVGWGEACAGADAPSIAAALQAMRPFVLGRDPWATEAIAADVFGRGLWEYRVQSGSFAFAGIDAALWDLCGKICGQPLHRLFGGPVRDHVDYFHYLAQGAPEAVAADAARGLARGYRCFYLKVGIDAAAEGRMLAAVRAAIGPDCLLRVDANEAWSPPEAARILGRWHAAFDLDFVEAPVPIVPLSLMEDLRRRVAVPLCANEGLGSRQDALRVIQSAAADYVCFSPFWVGTLRRFHELARLAAFSGKGVVKHTHGELGVAAAAAHQLLVTLPGVAPGCQQTHSVTDGDILTERLPIADGPCWGLPEGPGLGVEVDEARVAEAAARYRAEGPYLPYAA